MYFDNSFCKLYFEKYGNSNKSILILPGWGNNRNSFYNIINYFRDNYSIYIIDYPGFGKSSSLKKEMTIYDYAIMIKEFMEVENISNPIIIAHSFGGRLAILLSGFYGVFFEKMIFIDTAGVKERKNFRQIVRQLSYKFKKRLSFFIRNNEKKELYIKRLREKYSSSDYLMLPDNMHKTFKNIVNENLKKYLKFIKSEVLIIWGENDIDTSLNSGIIFNRKIKNSALIVLPKAGHFSYIEYKDLVISIMDKFI